MDLGSRIGSLWRIITTMGKGLCVATEVERLLGMREQALQEARKEVGKRAIIELSFL